MSKIENLTFFITPEHACGYLPEQQASSVFVDPNVKVDAPQATELSALGFRRSGNHFYRPHCKNCDACVPIRIPSNTFQPSRSQKRVWKSNKDLNVQVLSADFHEDHYLVYEKYINQRHADGDMYPPSREQYRSFLVEGSPATKFVEFSENDQLLGVAVVDELLDGLSAIYTFFEPEQQKRSLGTYAIMWQIEKAKEQNLPYVYLGYYIRRCRKMNYKTTFTPYEARISEHWLTNSQLEQIVRQSQIPPDSLESE